MTDSARLVLGSAQWGLRYGIANRGGPPTSREVAKMASRAWAAGVRTIDTARAYGTSEAIVGNLEAPWRVITKLDPHVAGATITADEARRRTAASLGESRRALHRERLDTVLLHRSSHLEESGGAAWSSLVEEQAAGRIGHLGVSVDDLAQADAILDVPDLAVIQVPASLLDRRVVQSRFFDRAADRRREVFVRSIYLQGVAYLEPEELPDHLAPLLPALTTIDAAASDLRVPRAMLFLAYARDRLPQARIVIGCESPAQLEENLAAWMRPIPAAALTAIEERLSELPAAVLDPARWPASSA